MAAVITELAPDPQSDHTHDGGERSEKLKLLESTMRRHHHRPDSLIEILHVAQELFGCLEPAVLRHIANALHTPASRVYGVATFYHLFSLTPPARHTCEVCMGTACYVKGSDAVLAAAIEAAGTAADTGGSLTLRTSSCIGACGLAPAVVIDSVVEYYQTPGSISTRLEELTRHGLE
ncbi:MAG: NAD(P)H-dependent oxidoreductase subunit E [Capsulimonadaceae bacterium]